MKVGSASFIFRYWGACYYRHPFIFAQPLKGAIACFSLKSRYQVSQFRTSFALIQLFGSIGLPALLATTSFGHLLGVGVILGLHNLGKL
jgi:photosystem I reaction center subunit PsaK